MRLPSQKKILKEDLKGAPNWVFPLIDVLNNFMESVYQTLNKNVDNDNLDQEIKEITVRTTSSYPVMEPIQFQHTLRRKALGLDVIQAVEKQSYEPASGPVYAPWIDSNGTIMIPSITGLQASKIYLIRLRIT